MLRSHLLGLLSLVPALAVGAAAGPEGYLRFPTLSDDRIAFTADGDLWSVARTGGMATRLTSAPGTENYAKWSPDGQWLSYAGSQHGNPEVYVIGREGGEPRRLTFDPSADVPVGWSPDGRVLFRSRRDGANYQWFVFAVSPKGGTPEKLKTGPAAILSVAADGETVAFNRLSVELRTWKRYLGGTAQDIWLGNLRTQQFRKLTQYPGNDINPAFWGDRVVFLSDRDGTVNVWSLKQDGTDLRQHTHHAEFDARFLDVARGTAVYTLGADVMTCDLASSTSARVPITLTTDLAQAASKTASPAEHLSDYDFSPDGHRLVVQARGELSTVPLKEGRTIELTRGNSGAHERGAAWSPDGKTIALVSDEGGEEAIWTVPADGSATPKRLTEPGTARLFAPQWSPDGKHLAYGTSDQDLRVADAKTGSVRTIARSEAWEIQDMAWSPDSRWLAFTMPVPNDSQVLELWDSRDSSLHVLTSTWVTSYSPAWDRQGRYLYFLSDRTFNPKLGGPDFSHIIDAMTKPHVLVLKKGERDPFFPKEEKSDEDESSGDSASKEKDGKSGKDKAAKKGKDEPAKPVVIDFDGLDDRIVAFPVEAGNLGGLSCTKDRVLWMSFPNEGLLGNDDEEDSKPNADLHVYDIEKKKDSVAVSGLSSYDVSQDGSRLAWKGEDGLQWQEGLERQHGSDDGKGDDGSKKVDLSSWRLSVDRRAEWRQIFDECWRLQREFFWDASLNGVDWQATHDRYAALLPRLTTREELNDLMGQLIGELCMGHTYIWSPGDLPSAGGESVGLLGATFAPDKSCDCQRFSHVRVGENWAENSQSPVTLPQAGVKDGDYLFAIDGRKVGAGDDPATFLLGRAGRLVALEVGSKPDRKLSRKVEVKTVGDDSRVRYLEWVRGNRERVTALSKGRIGYVHIPDMGGLGLSEFSRQFYQQLDKDALVIDDRYNGGGFVSQLIIERLRRALVSWDRPRRGQHSTYPAKIFLGPSCVLVNESAGSDGDIFPESYQKLELGPLIGMRTWGGVVGIRADKAFVDGGSSTQPEFAWWEPRKGWALENDGVHPDIEIDNDPAAVVAGRDPQLEKGVEYLLGKLEGWQRPRPEFGPAPPKSKNAFREKQRGWLNQP